MTPWNIILNVASGSSFVCWVQYAVYGWTLPILDFQWTQSGTKKDKNVTAKRERVWLIAARNSMSDKKTQNSACTKENGILHRGSDRAPRKVLSLLSHNKDSWSDRYYDMFNMMKNLHLKFQSTRSSSSVAPWWSSSNVWWPSKCDLSLGRSVLGRRLAPDSFLLCIAITVLCIGFMGEFRWEYIEIDVFLRCLEGACRREVKMNPAPPRPIPPIFQSKRQGHLQNLTALNNMHPQLALMTCVFTRLANLGPEHPILSPESVLWLLMELGWHVE